MFFEERNYLSTKKKNVFSLCCSQGKVKLPEETPLPNYILELLDDQKFMQDIRTYNAAFSFCSFDANTEEMTKFNKGSIYTMRISGMIYHRIGPILPAEGSKPKCAQIYIHDGEEEERLRQGNQTHKQLDSIIMQKLRLCLLHDCSNIFIRNFKAAAQMLKKNPSIDLKVILNNKIYLTEFYTNTFSSKIIIETNKNLDKRTYNKPSTSEVAILIPSIIDQDDKPLNRRNITFDKTGNLKFIDTNRAAYDPLQYPLMFPHG